MRSRDRRARLNVSQFVDHLLADRAFRSCVTAHQRMPPRAGKYREFPSTVDRRLVAALGRRGIHRLYEHQALAWEAAAAGKNVVVVTPTASGKTLCYNLPVLDAIARDPGARALYLFPTKALAQDQMNELHDLVNELGLDIKTHTYDGDTPANARRLIRSAGHIVITNPDMLHTGILPHHTKWIRLFENLRYVVLDEMHGYRGVFGSHLANVIRRLKRVCAFYGSRPQFICSSATIANPGELAGRLIEEDVEVVDRNGAPSGERHVFFYNPPLLDRQLGIRRSALLAAKELASDLLANQVQTIVFGRSRLSVEVLLTYLQEEARRRKLPEGAVRGYRGGYLPFQRREIERGLREGKVLGVVSTNALELGIDIGGLDASVLVGYPGTIASAWQQMGRAGRRSTVSLSIMVATSSPLDQFIVNHPEYFFSQAPENGLVNPDNLLILMSHLKCAAFELPFEGEEPFGPRFQGEMLNYLEEERILHRHGDRWYWMSDNFPAEKISLRTAAMDNFVIIDTTEGARVIGEMDRFAAPMLLHEEAIYLHEGQQYQVEKLDWEEKKAYVRRVNVDYYTDASLAVNLKVLDVFSEPGESVRGYGEVMVSFLPTIFKKIKLHTHENVGWGQIHLPEQEMHTTAYWLHLPSPLGDDLGRDELQGGLLGLAHLLVNVAPMFLMCDPRDIQVTAEVRSPFTGRPTVYLYENFPETLGFSEKLYGMRRMLLEGALDLVQDCPCESGCPSCVGPVVEVGEEGKKIARRLLEGLLSEEGKVKNEEREALGL